MIRQKNIFKGFSLVEVLLAGGIIAILVTAFAGVYIYGQESVMLSINRNRAVMLAEEGQEAVRNIRDNNFLDLLAGTHGLSNSGSAWQFAGSSDSVGLYTREIIISDIDSETKQIVSRVLWQKNQQTEGVVELVSYLTNWRESS